jgi:selenide,water dikinase
MDAVPLIEAAVTYARQGIVPGGTHANRRFLADSVEYAADLDEASQLLACDAQTSGGLLIAVAPDRTQSLLAALSARGTPCARVIGRLDERAAGTARVVRQPVATG